MQSCLLRKGTEFGTRGQALWKTRTSWSCVLFSAAGLQSRDLPEKLASLGDPPAQCSQVQEWLEALQDLPVSEVPTDYLPGAEFPKPDEEEGDKGKREEDSGDSSEGCLREADLSGGKAALEHTIAVGGMLACVHGTAYLCVHVLVRVCAWTACMRWSSSVVLSACSSVHAPHAACLCTPTAGCDPGLPGSPSMPSMVASVAGPWGSGDHSYLKRLAEGTAGIGSKHRPGGCKEEGVNEVMEMEVGAADLLGGDGAKLMGAGGKRQAWQADAAEGVGGPEERPNKRARQEAGGGNSLQLAGGAAGCKTGRICYTAAALVQQQQQQQDQEPQPPQLQQHSSLQSMSSAGVWLDTVLAARQGTEELKAVAAATAAELSGARAGRGGGDGSRRCCEAPPVQAPAPAAAAAAAGTAATGPCRAPPSSGTTVLLPPRSSTGPRALSTLIPSPAPPYPTLIPATPCARRTHSRSHSPLPPMQHPQQHPQPPAAQVQARHQQSRLAEQQQQQQQPGEQHQHQHQHQAPAPQQRHQQGIVHTLSVARATRPPPTRALTASSLPAGSLPPSGPHSPSQQPHSHQQQQQQQPALRHRLHSGSAPPGAAAARAAEVDAAPSTGARHPLSQPSPLHLPPLRLQLPPLQQGGAGSRAPSDQQPPQVSQPNHPTALSAPTSPPHQPRPNTPSVDMKMEALGEGGGSLQEAALARAAAAAGSFVDNQASGFAGSRLRCSSPSASSASSPERSPSAGAPVLPPLQTQLLPSSHLAAQPAHIATHRAHRRRLTCAPAPAALPPPTQHLPPAATSGPSSTARLLAHAPARPQLPPLQPQAPSQPQLQPPQPKPLNVPHIAHTVHTSRPALPPLVAAQLPPLGQQPPAGLPTLTRAASAPLQRSNSKPFKPSPAQRRAIREQQQRREAALLAAQQQVEHATFELRQAALACMLAPTCKHCVLGGAGGSNRVHAAARECLQGCKHQPGFGQGNASGSACHVTCYSDLYAFKLCRKTSHHGGSMTTPTPPCLCLLHAPLMYTLQPQKTPLEDPAATSLHLRTHHEMHTHPVQPCITAQELEELRRLQEQPPYFLCPHHWRPHDAALGIDHTPPPLLPWDQPELWEALLQCAHEEEAGAAGEAGGPWEEGVPKQGSGAWDGTDGAYSSRAGCGHSGTDVHMRTRVCVCVCVCVCMCGRLTSPPATRSPCFHSGCPCTAMSPPMVQQKQDCSGIQKRPLHQ